ncbi:hypothetical protein ACFPK9_14410 [Rubritalea spongiae]|uniref:hypothetical protein n=1 Tax=Rubritalea spongiae TaxID=430797 RepID=UPI00361595A0
MKKAWKEKGIPEDDWPDYVGDSNQFTPLGKVQLAKVSGKLQALEKRFDFIASSPLWRSRNTILPYMKDVGAKGEIWPELKELSIPSEYLFDKELPKFKQPVLEQGKVIEIPTDETDWFSMRAGVTRGFDISNDLDEKEESAAAKIVYQAAIDRILKKFGGTDKTILLAGHGASGKNLIRLLTGEMDYESIDNTGIWMVEQQEDGSFEVKIYNSVTVGIGAIPNNGKLEVRFSDLRSNLSDVEINGQTVHRTGAKITKATDGLDIVYSFSIKDQDLDGVGGSNDSLSWDIRFQGFVGGDVTLKGDDSSASVTLGKRAKVHASDDYFGVSDERYVDEGDSIQFSIENLTIQSDSRISVRFNGFDGVYGTDDCYIFGVGKSGLESKVTKDDADFTFTPMSVLTLSCAEGKLRVRDLTGSFTLSKGNEASLNQ